MEPMDKLTHEQTIKKIHNLFSREHRGKFTTDVSRMEDWALFLRDFDPPVILTAAYHLTSILDWPPTIHQMREQCALLSHGEIEKPSGYDAWERIQILIDHGIELEDLTVIEKKALDQTGKLRDIRLSKNLQADRARYIEAFDRLISRRHLENITMPEVRALVSDRAEKLLPKPKPKQLEKNTGAALDEKVEDNRLPLSEVSKFCQDVIGKIELKQIEKKDLNEEGDE